MYLDESGEKRIFTTDKRRFKLIFQKEQFWVANLRYEAYNTNKLSKD
jgi:hypothetical protein